MTVTLSATQINRVKDLATVLWSFEGRHQLRPGVVRYETERLAAYMRNFTVWHPSLVPLPYRLNWDYETEDGIVILTIDRQGLLKAIIDAVADEPYQDVVTELKPFDYTRRMDDMRSITVDYDA